jgi:hypothetical protein
MSFAVSQEPPKAVLVDELPIDVNCEELSARLDNFINELGTRPDATGYAIIGSAPAKPGSGRYLERYIDGYPRYRGFDETRLDVRRSNFPGQSIKLWMVPLGATFEVPASDYSFPGVNRKTEISSNWDQFGPCYTGQPFRLLSRYLKSDLDLAANIAIGSPSTKEYLAERKKITERYAHEYGVSSSRLRFFRMRGRYFTNVYELWLLKPKSTQAGLL